MPLTCFQPAEQGSRRLSKVFVSDSALVRLLQVTLKSNTCRAMFEWFAITFRFLVDRSLFSARVDRGGANVMNSCLQNAFSGVQKKFLFGSLGYWKFSLDKPAR